MFKYDQYISNLLLYDCTVKPVLVTTFIKRPSLFKTTPNSSHNIDLAPFK